MKHPEQRTCGHKHLWWALLAFAIVWIFGSAYVLHHFYNLGGMRDSLWFAGLAHHGDLAMSDPPSVAFIPGASFFHTHFSPIFYLPSALSYLVAVPSAVWYALWYGLIHALLTLCFWGLVAPLAKTAYAVTGHAIAALLALLFALNGTAIMALQMPHYELLIPALIVGMLALLTQARWRAATLLLFITLLVREDAGLHVAALLIPAYAWRRMTAGSQAPTALDRHMGQLGLIALLGAIACLTLQKVGWGDNGMLIRNYIGSPPLAHLTSDVLHARWDNFLHERSYLWVPFLLAGLWAVLERKGLILWGFVAYVPWLALQFVAKEDVMGTLSWYYAFPAIASLAWPIMAVRLSGTYTPLASRRAVWYVSIMLMSTMFGHLDGRYMVYPWTVLQGVHNPLPAMQADEAFMRVLETKTPELGELRLDNGVIALRPHAFQADQRAQVPQIETQRIDTLVWFDPGGFDNQSWALAISNGLRYVFAVPNSPIVLASRFDLQQDRAWQGVVKPTNLFSRRTQTELPHDTEGHGWAVTRSTPASVVLQAPLIQRQDGLYQIYSVSLPPGRYVLEARLLVQDFGDSGLPLFVLQRQHNWAPEFNEAMPVYANQLKALGNNRYQLTWPLLIEGHGPESYWPAMMQMAWQHSGQASYTIEGWSLIPSPDLER